MIVGIFSADFDCSIVLAIGCSQNTSVRGLLAPATFRANFNALTGLDLKSIIVDNVTRIGCILCADGYAAPRAEKISVLTTGANVITIGLCGIGDIVTESLRIRTYVGAKVSASGVVLEVFYSWIWEAVWSAQMTDWITPVVSSDAFFDTSAIFSKQWNYADIGAGRNALHVAIIFKLSARTGAVACTICGIKVRLGRRANRYTFFVSRIDV